MNKITTGKFFLFSVMVSLCSYISLGAQGILDERDYLVSLEDTISDLSLPKLNGGAISLSELKGKVVVLQFIL